MASVVKECYSWGIIGCGWLGKAFAAHITASGNTAWGTGRSPESCKAIAATGATPVHLDFGNPNGSEIALPPCHHLLVAMPPGAQAATAAQRVIHRYMDASDWTVLISSTSVYPEKEGIFKEEDAIQRISPHSGLAVKDVEGCYLRSSVSILRAGGLIGPGRPLFRPSTTSEPARPQRSLNIVHMADVIHAILHAAEAKLEGPINLVCPVSRVRSELFDPSAGIHPESTFGKKVSVHRLLDSGFTFLHPDPAGMPDLHP